MNDWCGEVLAKAIKYDDLITFFFFGFMIGIFLICLVVGSLGMLGYLQ